jgi:hypothetical protein
MSMPFLFFLFLSKTTLLGSKQFYILKSSLGRRCSGQRGGEGTASRGYGVSFYGWKLGKELPPINGAPYIKQDCFPPPTPTSPFLFFQPEKREGKPGENVLSPYQEGKGAEKPPPLPYKGIGHFHLHGGPQVKRYSPPP